MWTAMTLLELATCAAAGLCGLYLWPALLATLGLLVAGVVVGSPDVVLAPLAGLLPLLALYRGRRVLRFGYAAAWLALTTIWLARLVPPGQLADSVALNLALVSTALILSECLVALVRYADSEAERRVVDLRLEMARELHDSVARDLTHVVMRGERMTFRSQVGHDEVVAMTTAARHALQELRHIMHLLRSEHGANRPWVVDSLATSIEAAERRLLAEGFMVSVSSPEDSLILPDVIDQALARVVQEAVANIIRHGRRGPCELLFDKTDECVEVLIANLVATGRIRPAGLGIIGMRERLAGVGGELEAGVVKKRWVVHASVPLAMDGVV